MKLLVQFARGANPQGWEEFPSEDWGLLPNLPIAALCVQGLVLAADSYLVETLGDGSVVVRTEVDGPLSGRRQRSVVVPLLAPDPSLGGAYNTGISQVVFTDDLFPSVERTLVQPWASRVGKTAAWRNGVLLPDAQWNAHRALQAPRSWREWTEGLPASVLRNGLLVSQRRRGLYLPSRHTRTYYLNNVARPTGTHTADFELALQAVPAGVATIMSDQIQAAGILLVVGTTDTTEPNTAAWPTGDYRFQLDCLTVNSDVTFGLAPLGSTPKDGHFGRVNAALSSDLETHAQVEAPFSFPGLKLATYTGAWTAGSATDRFEVSVAADRPTGHGNAEIMLEIGEADDFADGAWAGTTTGDDANFFGSGV